MQSPAVSAALAVAFVKNVYVYVCVCKCKPRCMRSDIKVTSNCCHSFRKPMLTASISICTYACMFVANKYGAIKWMAHAAYDRTYTQFVYMYVYVHGLFN